MDRKAIALKLSQAVVGIYVFLGEERISSGSGFLYNDQGSVFTAGHVIHNGRPFTSKELQDPALKIWVKIRGRPPIEYQQALPPLVVESTAFNEKLIIDIGGLNPKEPITQPTSFLVTRIREPVLGEDVMLAGYPDEIYLPFGYDKRLKPSLVGLQDFIKARATGFDVELGALMIKSGIVGSSTGFMFGGNSSELRGWVFFVDNAMHRGGSGGPVVDENGEAFGVITERAVTRLGEGPMPDLKVPSGTTHAMTLEPLQVIKPIT